MTEQLQKDARAFLTEVEEEVKAECQQSAGDEIARLNAAHAAEIEALNAAHAAEIEALNAAHAAEISKMQADFDVRIVQERERYYNEGFADGKTEQSQGAGVAGTEPEPEPVYSGTLSFTDPAPCSVGQKLNVATFAYTRKYKSTKWGTIVLPVALDYADWKARFEIAEIVGVTINADGTYTAKRQVLGAGSSTVPNRPYLIRSKANIPAVAQTIRKTNCTVFPAEPGMVKIVAEGKTFRFRGTYAPIAASALKGFYYASGGKFVPATSGINPMRVFLEIF